MLSGIEFNENEFKIKMNGMVSDSFERSFFEYRPFKEIDEASYVLTQETEESSFVPTTLDLICGNPLESIRVLIKSEFGYFTCTKIKENVDLALQNLTTNKGMFKGLDSELRSIPEALIFYNKNVNQKNRLFITFANLSGPMSKECRTIEYYPVCFEDKVIFCWQDSEMYSILHR